ncbi:MAG TPA: DUF1302 family protein [Polyangia bacterium]|nr:DUF1302 family protein [Polyangia bacterium]
MRTPHLLVSAVLLLGARAVHAQADAGTAAPPPATATPDGGAAPAAPAAPSDAPTETGGGLFEQSQAAAAAPANAGPEAAAAKPPFTLNGYARGDLFAGKVPGQNAAEMKAAYGELSLQLRTAKSTYGDGFAEARVRYGLQGADHGTFVDLREAYVNAYLGPVDLRIGQQIIVWGRADALNPTNNITPVDFRIRSPLEDDIRVGNVGARGFLRLAPLPLRLEGVWMPVYLATELPPVALPQYVYFGTPTFPSPDLRNGLGAGRLHLELPAFEASVSYLRGYAPLPGLALQSVTFDPNNPSVVVTRTAYQQQVIGLDFSTALGDVLTLRGEAAYRRPTDYQTGSNQNPSYLARPDLQYVVGVDHTFGSTTVIAQYLGRYVFDWQKAMGPSMSPDMLVVILKTQNPADFGDMVNRAVNSQLAKQSQILFGQTAKVQHIATLRVESLLAHETLSLSSLVLVNFTTQEWLITPRIGWRMSDAMTAYVGAQVFHGPTDTLFGLIDADLSAGYAELRFTY